MNEPRCPHRWKIAAPDANPTAPEDIDSLLRPPTPAVCRLCGAHRTFLASLDSSPRSRAWWVRQRARKAAEALL